MMGVIQVGGFAPPFHSSAAFCGETLSAPVRSIALTQYRGRWLIFFWYPADFTFVCPTEITALSDRHVEFQERDCDILGASTDSVYSHRAWLQTPRSSNGIADIAFPLLADKSNFIAREWGILIEQEGIALRALFIIDPDGIVQYQTVHNLNIGRSVDETLRVLDGLQSGGLCPSDWKPSMSMLESVNT